MTEGDVLSLGVHVKVLNRSSFPLPEYQTQGSAGMDIHADVDENVVFEPLDRKLIPTGLFLEIPAGFEIQIRPRSGMAFKKGISLPNTPATIDSDYRGEVKVALINFSRERQLIEPGDRIAQLVLKRVETIEWEEVKELQSSERGAGGFGHTGTKK